MYHLNVVSPNVLKLLQQSHKSFEADHKVRQGTDRTINWPAQKSILPLHWVITKR